MPRCARWFQLAATLAILGCGPKEASVVIEPEIAPRLDGRKTTQAENLHAFARLYGYVRWFHPTEAAAGADWRVLAAAGARAVRDAENLGDLRTRLQEHLGPLAPQMEMWVDGETPPEPDPPPHHRDELVYWQHEGYVGTRLSLYSPPYGQVRVNADGPYRRRFSEAPGHDARIEVELVPGLHLRMPLVLTPKQAGHDIDVTLVDPKLVGAVRSANGWKSLDVRQGAVVEVWNVFRHFYPYQETIPIAWDQLLDQALVDAEDDATLDDAAATLWRLVSALQDGHGMVGHRDLLARGQLPIRVELVEGEPVVTGTEDPQFAIGDVIESIDGVALRPRVEALAKRLSGSPQWRKFRAAAWEALAGPRDAEVVLGVRRGTKMLTRPARYTAAAPPRPPRPPAVHRFDDGVHYVDLTRAHWEDVLPTMPELAMAPGVVFDMRGYPTDTHRILPHLLSKGEATSWMQVPRIIEPDGRICAWEPIGWNLQPAEPRVAGEVVFLMDAEAISFAESVLMYVEAHDLGTLVGSPTAGADGDIVRVDTLGGFFVVFTGMKVTRHDGSRLHVEGVKPEVEVTPTRKGLMAGRDEVLEAGLERVRKTMVVAKRPGGSRVALDRSAPGR